MKKIAALILILVVLFGAAGSFTAQAAAQSELIMKIGLDRGLVGGTAIVKTNAINGVTTKVQKVGGRTMVPLRFVSQTLGAVVKWDEKTKTATVSQNGISVSVKIGQNTMTKTDAKGKVTQIAIDVPATLIQGSTYLPIRAIGQSLGFKVYYTKHRSQEFVVVYNTSISTGAMTNKLENAYFILNGVGEDYKKGTVYGPRLTDKQLGELKTKVSSVVSSTIKTGMGDDDKVKVLHDYLVRTVSYDDNYSAGYNANTAWGALIRGKAACSGYARGFKALCDAAGIPCYYVHATNSAHQWNIVCVDGNWYHIDVQCNDDSGFYAIFLVSDDDFAWWGQEWDRKSLPSCPREYGE